MSALDADEILSAIQSDAQKQKGGKLTLFLGMAAGVGKTVSMLKEAQLRQQAGESVWIGIVMTHGRQDTETWAQGLPRFPLKKWTYKHTELEEMDLDAILEKKPQLVLVDELAHTNVPGCRHPKRWQDVLDILEAGIDVYTTLNIQHMESRKETVEEIAGIQVHETVPDSILERANHVKLIDLTPEELLQRLKEGKVYLGEKADLARDHFFKLDRLTALRELSLRATAEKVDKDLQDLTYIHDKQEPWKSAERLMVAISPSPHSKPLIRATRRLAFALEAPWIAVFVDTGKPLSGEERTQLSKNLTLARELGAEVITTTDTDILSAIQRVVVQKNVSQLVVGRAPWSWWTWLKGGGLPNQVIRAIPQVHVHVLSSQSDRHFSQKKVRVGVSEARPQHYLSAIGIVGALTLLNLLLVPLIGYKSVGYVFLLAVMGIGLRWSIGPVLVAAFLSAFVWDVIFTPPIGSFSISSTEDGMLLLLYVVSALVTGSLMVKIRFRERMLQLRQARNSLLYHMAKTMATAQTRDHCFATLTEAIRPFLKGECTFYYKAVTDTWSGVPASEKEAAVFHWVLTHQQPAGWATETLPEASAMYIPLKGPSGLVGVLSFQGDTHLVQEEELLLFALANQVGIYLERELFRDRVIQDQKKQVSDRVYEVLLDSVSHEIKTPITALIGMVNALQNPDLPHEQHAPLLAEIDQAANRLTHVVENLLDMSRLHQEKAPLTVAWQDPEDIVRTCLERHKHVLETHHIQLHIDASLPLVKVDFQLMEHALSNVLLNSATYSHPGSTISVKLCRLNHFVLFQLSDEGPGIPYEQQDKVFEKFYRVPGTLSGGTGLGLTITKSVLELHGGQIQLRSAPSGGLQVDLMIPVEDQPDYPKEALS